MAAVAWYEVMRGLRGPQREALNSWRGRINIIPIDAQVANRAARIHQASRKSGKLCPKCFCFKQPLHCDLCGNQRSEPQRSNDIVMVATADVRSDVGVLYSWDKGVLALGEHVTEVQIKNPVPPPPQQIELPGATDIRAGQRTRKSRAKRRGSD